MSKRKKRKQRNKNVNRKESKVFNLKPSSTRAEIEESFNRMRTRNMVLGARTLALACIQIKNEWDERHPVKTIVAYQEFQDKITAFLEKMLGDKVMEAVFGTNENKTGESNADEG